MKKVEYLNLDGFGVSSLADIVYFTNVQHFQAPSNSIVEVTELLNLVVNNSETFTRSAVTDGTTMSWHIGLQLNPLSEQAQGDLEIIKTLRPGLPVHYIPLAP